MIGVILAGGTGSRMQPFSENYPKPILPVGNKPIIGYQLETLRILGIQRVIVVIGYLGHHITQFLGNGEYYGVQIEYIQQKEPLGIAHAVAQLEGVVTEPFVLFLGDIFFITNDLAPLIQEFNQNETQAILATKIESDPEMIKRNFAVLADDAGMVHRVIEKPRFATTPLKGCGIYVFDLPIFDAIRRTPRTALRNEYEITEAIQIFIDDGYRVKHLPLITDDLNLTYPQDLLEINQIFLRSNGLEYLLGEHTQIPTGTKLDQTILGNHVILDHPIELHNTVVFDHTHIQSRHLISNMILTPYQEIHLPSLDD
jgi:dTDP-glucose pyrophosphorylase